MSSGHASALRITLPQATVLDAFQVVRIDRDALDPVRRSVQHERLGQRGYAGAPLFGIRRLFPGQTHEGH